MKNISSKETLTNYIDGSIMLTSFFNLMFSEGYDEKFAIDLGKHVKDVLHDHETIHYINGFKNKSDKDFPRHYCNFFYTSMLDLNSCIKMFGEPLYHDEFGEGFDNGESESQSASFFLVDDAGLIYNINIDHRGTSVQVPECLDKNGAKVFLKELVNKFKEIV